MIMRSHDRLSTTQHRLLFGLCISDILSSICYSTFNAMAPSVNNYYTWNARGNDGTCLAQGFLLLVGIYCGIFYNASLNIYYLAVVKYNKSNEFIRAKIEPFLHAVPIVVALCYGIYRLVQKQLNDRGGVCISSVNAVPHCVGYDVGEIREGFGIPCWRGIEGIWIALISYMTLMLICVLIMMVSLGMIFSAVTAAEKKLAKYGVGALRSNTTTVEQQQQQQSASTQHTEQDEQSSGVWARMTTSLTSFSTSLRSRTWSCRKAGNDNAKPAVIRSNSMRSQSRAVMHKAFGYSFAWFLAHGFYMIGVIIELSTGEFPLVLSYIATIFGPLQGFFNLLIFMHPKIVAAKKAKKRRGRGGNNGSVNISWCHAILIAFRSRGKSGKNQNTSLSNLRLNGSNRRLKQKSQNETASLSNLRLGGDSSNHQLKQKSQNEDSLTDHHVKSPMFGRIKKETTTKRRRDEALHQEEEKCEIQAPGNLNPIQTKAMYSATSTATYAPNIVRPLRETAISNSNSNNSSRLGVVNPPYNAVVEIKRKSVEKVEFLLEDGEDEKEEQDDQQEEMNEAEEVGGNVAEEEEDDSSPPASSTDMNKQVEIAMENDQDVHVGDEMNVDDESSPSEPASMDATKKEER